MTTVSSDHPNPTGSVYGDDVTFMATVSAASGTPTGNVQFQIDGVDYGSPVPLDASEMASFDTHGLAAGDHTITGCLPARTRASATRTVRAQHVSHRRCS